MYSKDDTSEQMHLLEDLESLGLFTIRLNEFNDNAELRNLSNIIKEAFLEEYARA